MKTCTSYEPGKTHYFADKLHADAKWKHAPNTITHSRMTGEMKEIYVRGDYEAFFEYIDS
jgi:hypothetical protein